ncbi:hypothetical protein B0T24DRAFT_610148 [Lasiosphaeria ovina]|uniref:Uncharacterized protein n=1 Tax=Lasiosphaeria ovina TaxID=92902 RepID=A0AAE0KLU0_9PEZI|nr:hypothetical protein B0T24DRAFT_610148 [Lasiosphaeria ovina]
MKAMESLPKLTEFPTRHPASCASLSLPLLDLLDAVLPPPPRVTLSVGSGPGLLEALLLLHHPHRASANPVSLYGVEVDTPGCAAPVNRFLPEPNAAVVPGTWAVAREAAAEAAEGLLFVYPRQPALMRTYLLRGANVHVAVWIGPKCDLDEFTAPLREWGDEDVDVGGRFPVLVENGEAVVVFRRRGLS